MNTHDFQVRVTRRWEEVSPFFINTLSKTDKGFVFPHYMDAENIHIHAYYFKYITKRKSYAEQLTKKLDISGAQYETSSQCGKKPNTRPLDVSGAWAYGSKFGTIAPVYLKNISPALVEELNEYARTFFDKKAAPNATSPPPTTQSHHKKKEDSSLFSLWLTDIFKMPEAELYNNDQERWQTYINRYFISRQLPYPRAGDCIRYARSIRDIIRIRLAKPSDKEYTLNNVSRLHSMEQNE